MTYSPLTDSIRERILQNLESTIGAIAPPTYSTKVAVVQRFAGNDLLFANYPGVAIVPGVLETNDQRLGLLEHKLQISLLVMVKSQRWRRDLDRLLSDLRVAILEDWTRGGVALDTHATVEEIVDSEPSSPLGAARMDLEVLYRTLYHDPGSAI